MSYTLAIRAAEARVLELELLVQTIRRKRVRQRVRAKLEKAREHLRILRYTADMYMQR